jgi:hypothetical protein
VCHPADTSADIRRAWGLNINGHLEFNTTGELSFAPPYTRLNAFGPYQLTATLNWAIVRTSMSPRRRSGASVFQKSA